MLPVRHNEVMLCLESERIGMTMTDGLSILELSDLPAAWRAIIRLLMRRQPQTYAALAASASALPGSQRLDSEQFDLALLALQSEGYIIEEGSGDERLYQMRIARRSGRTMANNLWNALEPDEADSAPPVEKPAPKRPRPDLFSRLS